ncbi:helix-turn-helix domain-containing protein [Nitratireductor alexandrii]|uniref:helix-turn-helix domain-containing protein n=1 Tax=Nitratireductor alexandrii TaxID=2448161 RepID=UPI000FDC3FEA|nr:XRE family transcriptional regulator [Nitratireductor alexandrii]
MDKPTDRRTPKRMEPADRRVRMGERLREIRHERGLTLAEVAKSSRLAVSTVSKVERGLMALTYDRFSQLADGLGVDVSALFSEHGERFRPGEVAVSRIGEFRLHETENYSYEMLFPDLWHKGMTPMLGTLRPLETMRFDRFISHAGEEFAFVIDGSVTIHFQDLEPVTLATGESAYFDSGRGHLYAAAGPDGARMLVVCTRPFEPQEASSA